MSTFAILTPFIRLFELGTGSSRFSGLGLGVSTLLRRILAQAALCRKATGKNEEILGAKVNLMRLSWIKVHCEKDRISSTLAVLLSSNFFCSNEPAA